MPGCRARPSSFPARALVRRNSTGCCCCCAAQATEKIPKLRSPSTTARGGSRSRISSTSFCSLVACAPQAPPERDVPPARFRHHGLLPSVARANAIVHADPWPPGRLFLTPGCALTTEPSRPGKKRGRCRPGQPPRNTACKRSNRSSTFDWLLVSTTSAALGNNRLWLLKSVPRVLVYSPSAASCNRHRATTAPPLPACRLPGAAV